MLTFTTGVISDQKFQFGHDVLMYRITLFSQRLTLKDDMHMYLIQIYSKSNQTVGYISMASRELNMHRPKEKK